MCFLPAEHICGWLILFTSYKEGDCGHSSAPSAVAPTGGPCFERKTGIHVLDSTRYINEQHHKPAHDTDPTHLYIWVNHSLQMQTAALSDACLITKTSAYSRAVAAEMGSGRAQILFNKKVSLVLNIALDRSRAAATNMGEATSSKEPPCL